MSKHNTRRVCIEFIELINYSMYCKILVVDKKIRRMCLWPKLSIRLVKKPLELISRIWFEGDEKVVAKKNSHGGDRRRRLNLNLTHRVQVDDDEVDDGNGRPCLEVKDGKFWSPSSELFSLVAKNFCTCGFLGRTIWSTPESTSVFEGIKESSSKGLWQLAGVLFMFVRTLSVFGLI